MKQAGFVANSGTLYTLVSPSASVANLGAIGRSLLFPLGGNYWGLHPGAHRDITMATALIGIAGAGALAVCATRVMASFPVRKRTGATPIALYTAFWVTCVLAGVIVIAVASVNDADTYFARYVLGPYVALIALLPLLITQGRRLRVVTCIAVALLIAIAIARSATTVVTPPLSSQTTNGSSVRALTNFARREHVRVGYATYWDAYDSTWQSGFAIELFPGHNCGTQPVNVCADTTGATNWFAPRRGVRTMLVTDSGPYSSLSSPGTRFGKPLAVSHIGEMTVYVYGYDIASRFARAS
jgi:hypothetical protein